MTFFGNQKAQPKRTRRSQPDAGRDGGEKRTKPYQTYGEGASEPPTKSGAGSTGGVSGSAAEQDGAVRTTGVPKHVAIILDGNRRWAKQRGLPAQKGHYYGLYKALWPTVLDAPKQGVKFLTVWAFSTETWKRSPTEIEYLFKLFDRGIRNRINQLNHAGIRIKVIGQSERFPASLQQVINDAVDRTKDNTGMTFTMALSYGGRAELIAAARKLVGRRPSEVTEQSLAGAMYDPDLPDVDLLIRTSGERRLSGFMPWHLHYAELYFTDKMWPDFGPGDLAEALRDFAGRQRRFGA